MQNLIKSIRTSTPNTLHNAYEAVCDTYAQRLIEQLGLHKDDAYWVLDEVGYVFAFGDNYFLNMEEIVLLVDNCIGYDEFDEWYSQWTDFDKENRINLRSWIMGARPGMFNNQYSHDNRRIQKTQNPT